MVELNELPEDVCGRIQLPKDPLLCSLHFIPDALRLLVATATEKAYKQLRQETLDAIC